MKHRIAVVAGGTGLVGGQLVRELLLDADWDKVYVIVRKPLSWSHPKLEPILVDWNRFPDLPKGITDAFSALGTTIQQAGTRENFRKVDFDYAISFAKAAKSNGVRGFSLISSLGADSKSIVFYNKVKGEVEGEISRLGFEYLGIFRPSLLEGDRKEFRIGEKIGAILAMFLNPILIGPFRKYRSIEGSVVAKAMLNAAWADLKGTIIIESDKIQELGSSTVRDRIPKILKKEA
ncbi:NAD(P)H-binding protein, PF13460 family [Leptospira inadai serovar Lyme str. 10]|uniref:NAD(P)H-binding protein, PF13460 family n=2 Tax=Leptospira inadai serovar Lyme TaxID=293084 RepID=V6HB96_9LEPT|nr:oxidoreductase [Leptospira inadai]EQA36657.1 NAD(P)H-binding protein, PF13460 family [Leptospira inadai serovar Lyme str. 10]PNV75763.1 oxidoreductase [Leptospira inadai serovar Lyme]